MLHYPLWLHTQVPGIYQTANHSAIAVNIDINCPQLEYAYELNYYLVKIQRSQWTVHCKTSTMIQL